MAKTVASSLVLFCCAFCLLACIPYEESPESEDASTDTDTDTDSDSDGDTGADTDTDADADTDSDADSDTDAETCPEGTEEHTTSSGETVCCDSEHPVFCDETSEGYAGGCWTEDADCATITECEGGWRACAEDELPYCTADDEMWCVPCPPEWDEHITPSGLPVCCSDEQPVFCDEALIDGEFYPGSCWNDGYDCSTIANCDGTWYACPSGREVDCELLICVDPKQPA